MHIYICVYIHIAYTWVSVFPATIHICNLHISRLDDAYATIIHMCIHVCDTRMCVCIIYTYIPTHTHVCNLRIRRFDNRRLSRHGPKIIIEHGLANNIQRHTVKLFFHIHDFTRCNRSVKGCHHHF